MTDAPEHWPDPRERPAQYLGDVPPMRPRTVQRRANIRFGVMAVLIVVSMAAVLILTSYQTPPVWVIVFVVFVVVGHIAALWAGHRAAKIDRRRLDAYHWQMFDLDRDPEEDDRLDS